ncbi:MAG: FHA domain-containing protein [Chloroflexi bacterium]|nr:FHA domain-containing protein [Chloroflexota bacterium]
MPLDVVLLILRLAVVGLLYLFLLTLAWFIWQDVQAANREAIDAIRRFGRLAVVRSHEDVPVQSGDEFTLLPLTTLGRGPTNSITLRDSFASANHAQILLRGEQWWLEDLGSRNGTLLNGVLVETPTVLSSGDVIQIGRVELRIDLAVED